MKNKEIRSKLKAALGQALRTATTPYVDGVPLGATPHRTIETIAHRWQVRGRGAARQASPGPAAPALELVALSVRRQEVPPPRRFCDPRSRRQIAVYMAYRLRACDERNERSLARWNRYLREQWELDHLGSTRAAAPERI